MADNQPQVVVKNGEITGKPIYQVRGDPHWHSTPAKARQAHESMKQAIAKGYYKRKEVK